MRPFHKGKAVTIYVGDCREILPTLPTPVDAVVCDPPYGLSFMGKGWDRGVPGVEFWEAISDAAKPGAHLLAFGGTRTFHRLTCAIEDAGWEIRDCLMWVYGTGFPKSLDVSKAIDKAAGAEREVVGTKVGLPGYREGSTGARGNDYGDGLSNGSDKCRITAPATDAAQQWVGWGTALKPAWEPIILARKPLVGTVAANVLEHGTGALNIDATRVGSEGGCRGASKGDVKNSDTALVGSADGSLNGDFAKSVEGLGRWPANVIHDGSDEVVELFPEAGGGFGVRGSGPTEGRTSYAMPGQGQTVGYGDTGTAARFFYCAKASKAERNAGMLEGETNTHPTVKPIALMRYLCRLVTPPGGLVLDPFAGSGSTLIAAKQEGLRSVGIDLEREHCLIARNRLKAQRAPK